MDPSVWLIELDRSALFLAVSERTRGFRWGSVYEAVRFARREDAEAVRLALHLTIGDGRFATAHATEHVFQAASAA